AAATQPAKPSAAGQSKSQAQSAQTPTPQPSAQKEPAKAPVPPQAAQRTPNQVEVIMPQMGESIFEGTITKWLKKAGDAVQKDEPLFEISTDKVDAEIPAPVSGILTEIKIPEGSTVQINTVVAVIGGTPAVAQSDGSPTQQ